MSGVRLREKSGARCGVVAIGWVVFGLVAPALVVAQSSEPAAPTAPTEPTARSLEPPTLLEAATPLYPAIEDAGGATVVVDLRLTIDAEGRVVAVEVLTSGGPAFDEAAREAALRSRFFPARRDGIAMASRIPFRVEVRPPVAEVPAVAPTEPEPPLVATDPEPTAVEPEPQAEAAPTPAAAAAAAPDEVWVEAIVESAADSRRASAEAVTVIEFDRARRESADLGEVLARTNGVSVRRGGGLGSNAAISLNGLTDDQVRLFVDGIPIELQGYIVGIGNIPTNLVDTVEIFSGVVPVRYGADALGGVIDVRTDPRVSGTHAAASYEVGSFGTHRVALSGRHRFDRSGFFVSGNGFFDRARNDYWVDDVLVPDDVGRETAVRVRRFHDRYLAGGGNVELGFVDRPWARRLVLRGFTTAYEQQIQTNPQQEIVYGGITYGERAAGGSLRYEQDLRRGGSVQAVTGYAYQRSHYLDVDDCTYLWTGECTMRTGPGETSDFPRDQLTHDHTVYGRYEIRVHPAPDHELRIAAAPTYFTRDGDERLGNPNEVDRLNAERRMFTFVGGAEYVLTALGDRLENIAFGKFYGQRIDNEDITDAGIVLPRDARRIRGGGGDALRYRFTDALYGKVSYEYATRLPSAEETFGNNLFTIQGYEGLLRPEVSHNVNVGLTLNARDRPRGDVRAGVTLIARSIRDLITQISVNRNSAYLNIADARCLGGEASAGWTSRRQWVVLEANLTYLHFTNVSKDGAFEGYRGDRIPNRPFLFANATIRVNVRDLIGRGDELSFSSYTRFVHSFWLGWESIGSAASRPTVPFQLVETLAVTYLRRFGGNTASASLEAQNVGDARVYDFFGSQRPGRAFYLKFTIEH